MFDLLNYIQIDYKLLIIVNWKCKREKKKNYLRNMLLVFFPLNEINCSHFFHHGFLCNKSKLVLHIIKVEYPKTDTFVNPLTKMI